MKATWTLIALCAAGCSGGHSLGVHSEQACIEKYSIPARTPGIARGAFGFCKTLFREDASERDQTYAACMLPRLAEAETDFAGQAASHLCSKELPPIAASPVPTQTPRTTQSAAASHQTLAAVYPHGRLIPEDFALADAVGLNSAQLHQELAAQYEDPADRAWFFRSAVFLSRPTNRKVLNSHDALKAWSEALQPELEAALSRDRVVDDFAVMARARDRAFPPR